MFCIALQGMIYMVHCDLVIGMPILKCIRIVLLHTCNTISIIRNILFFIILLQIK